MKNITVATIHYNTPELTEAAINSLRRHGGEKYEVVVFDNSDRRPFTAKMKGVKVIDNTKGQIVDFEAELAKYPDKCWELAHKSNYGSAKHMMSVQKLFELIPNGFILMESDILIKDDISFLLDEKYAACGKVRWNRGRTSEKDRLLPFLCYLNVPLLTANGARYFDPKRCWALLPGGKKNPNNWYDTGAALLEDIIKTKPQLVARLYPSLDHHFVHYTGGSWRQNDIEHQKEWLGQNRAIWEPVDNSKVKIYICTHTDFEPVVHSKVYETIDIRKGGDTLNGVPGQYYSELLHMYRVSKRKKLPQYIGFCHYRRYFGFMDDLPDIPKIIDQCGAITTQAADLRMPMQQQFGTWGNPEDLDICTQIINEKYKAFAPAWNASLASRKMHLGSLHIMKREDWMEMFNVMWDVAQEYLKRIGGDIDKHVQENPEAYHLDRFTAKHETRVGGQFAERIVSAWIDWKFPKAVKFPLNVTQEKVDSQFVG